MARNIKMSESGGQVERRCVRVCVETETTLQGGERWRVFKLRDMEI